MTRIRHYAHAVRFIWLSLPIIYRLANGRWYVFRDEPDWLVFEWAAMRVEKSDGLIYQGRKQAFEETMSRMNKIMATCLGQLKAMGEEKWGKAKPSTDGGGV